MSSTGARLRIAWLDDDESGEANEAWHFAHYDPNNRPTAYILAHYAAPPSDSFAAISIDALRAAHARAQLHTVDVASYQFDAAGGFANVAGAFMPEEEQALDGSY